MDEPDTQREEMADEIIPLPLCDEHEPSAARESERLDPGDDDVVGHGGWDFDNTTQPSK
jgi:hypothetical protein